MINCCSKLRGLSTQVCCYIVTIGYVVAEDSQHGQVVLAGGQADHLQCRTDWWEGGGVDQEY